jgi:hypothetical protein
MLCPTGHFAAVGTSRLHLMRAHIDHFAIGKVTTNRGELPTLVKSDGSAKDSDRFTILSAGIRIAPKVSCFSSQNLQELKTDGYVF